jgi:hypothetical protein
VSLEALEEARAEVERIAQPFFDQGYDHVVAAAHCGRLYVGCQKPTHCGVCKAEIEIFHVTPGKEGGVEIEP